MLVSRESHLLWLVRYLALNPVRGGAVRNPSDWPWSSYAATIGKATGPEFLAADEIRGLFATDQVNAARRIRAFVEGIRSLRSTA